MVGYQAKKEENVLQGGEKPDFFSPLAQ